MLHGNVSRNGYGNAVIGRYGGCFEEDSWLMCRWTGWSSPTELDVLAKYAPISMWERALRSTEEASKIWKWKCQKPRLTMHFIYCKQLAISMFHKWLETPREGSWRRQKCPIGFPDRCSNYPLGTSFQLSRIHDTLHCWLRLFSSEKYGSLLY